MVGVPKLLAFGFAQYTLNSTEEFADSRNDVSRDWKKSSEIVGQGIDLATA